MTTLCSPSLGSQRLLRSKSMDALEARRRRLADDVRTLQQADHLSTTTSSTSVPRSAILSTNGSYAASEAANLRRLDLWAQAVSEHSELVARAMDLDRITADAIYESQALAEASRAGRQQRHGICSREVSFANSTGLAATSWGPPMSFVCEPKTLPLHVMSPPRVGHSLLSTLGDGIRVQPSRPSAIGRSALDISGDDYGSRVPTSSLDVQPSRFSGLRDRFQSSLSGNSISGAFPTLLPPPSSFALPHRSLGSVDVGLSRTIDFSSTVPQFESPRPPIYSADSPRRQRKDLKVFGSPLRPVLPSRAEAAYVGESPRELSPYRQPPLSGNSFSMLTSSSLMLPGGGIAEIRARRERRAREVLRRSSDNISTTWTGLY